MHLLVIEDNPDLVANLCDFMEAKGHTVDASYNGHAGLYAALEGIHDAIILDLTLPGLDGLTVCQRLREMGKETPLLMLTARDTLDDKLVGFSRGADDYLVKPFALQELEARLTALVRRAKGEHTRRRFQVANLTFDPDTLSVQRAGTPITLPRTPLKILALLIRSSPRVVTRQEIEQEIWGESPPDSDALRAHMHTLRAAVDKPFDKPLLETIHGIGYRLADPDARSK